MKRVPLVLLLSVAMAGCSSKALRRQTVEVRAEPSRFHAEALPLDPVEEKINRHAYYYYVSAALYEQMGNAYMAAVNYRKALTYYPDSYEIAYSLAENLYRIQKIDEGLKMLEEISPKDAAVHNLRAAFYRAKGDEDSTRIAYLEVVRLDSTDSQAYAFLASAYRRMKDLDSTIWAYENLARIRGDNYRLWTELARLQAENGDYEASKESFQKSVEQAPIPQNIHAFLGLAQIYQLTQRFDSALVVLKRAVEIDSTNILIHRELRSTYVSLDSLPLAVPHARKEVELTPLDRSAVRRLAMLYYWMDSLEQSDSLFSYLVESGERHPVNHSYLGRIAMRNEQLERARDEFIVLTQLADSVYESWLDLGFAYRQLGQQNKEIETYQTGISHMRDDAGRSRLLFALGAAYERYTMIPEAVATFEEIIAANPDYDQALNYLGYMLADRGERLSYARDLLERAVALSPDNAAYLDSYGWVFYRLGDYEEALVYLKKAVNLDSDPVIFDHLGDVYKAVGNIDQARTWWQKALEMDPDNEEIKEKLGL